MRRLVVLLLALLVCNGLCAQESIPVVRFTVDGYEVVGDNPLGFQASEKILGQYTGQFEGLDGLMSAADTLQSALSKAGYPFHRVTLPPQTLQDGIVQLRVVAVSLGDVIVEGNQHFSDQNIRYSLPGLTPGMTPDTALFGRSLNLVNRHPRKQVAINLRQSAKSDAVDAVVSVDDRRPWQLFMSASNIGGKATGRSRISFGAEYTNLFNLDHSITGSYTTSPENADDVEQYGFNYQAPLYRYSTYVTAFYTKSDVNSGLIGGFFDVSGTGEFYGVGARHVLKRIGGYTHEMAFDIQDRDFVNDVNFLGTPIGVDVRSRPYTFRYQANYRAGNNFMGFMASYVRNWGSGANNNDRVYALSRAGASASWDAFRFNGFFDHYFPKGWIARVAMNAQLTDDPLISGEQFGVGGANSVRGFDERAVAGDSGVRISVEMWTPEAPFLPNLRGLVFFDVGHRDIQEPQLGEIDSDTISSTGVGVRYQFSDKISATLDYGHSLARGQRTVAGPKIGNARLHGNILIRY